MNTPEDNRKQNTTIDNTIIRGSQKENKREQKKRKEDNRRHKKTKENKGRHRS